MTRHYYLFTLIVFEYEMQTAIIYVYLKAEYHCQTDWPLYLNNDETQEDENILRYSSSII